MVDFAEEVWRKLSKIDVKEHIQKKGKLNYLSWAWAWGELKKAYPDCNYEFKEPFFYPDGTCEVWVTLTIGSGENALSHAMWLPVMDNYNKAFKNPDARRISDTRMRCLAKVIAMFGLGHYIYAGEDVPQNGDYDDVTDSYTKDQQKQFGIIFKSNDSLGMWVFRKAVGDEVYASLCMSFPSEKTKNKGKIKVMEKEALSIIDDYKTGLKDCIAGNDALGFSELALSSLHSLVKKEIFSALTPEEKTNLEPMVQELKEAA